MILMIRGIQRKIFEKYLVKKGLFYKRWESGGGERKWIMKKYMFRKFFDFGINHMITHEQHCLFDCP